MIHFPHPWLRWLEETSHLLNSGLGPIESATVLAKLPEIEFRIHTSLFAIRKIEESIEVGFSLASTKVLVAWWPVTEEMKAEVCRSPDPDFGRWYRLETSQSDRISYKEIINLFVHARICNFSFIVPTSVPLHDIGVFVASDHKMKDRIFLVPVGVIDSILKHGISIFRPVVERREKRKAEPHAPPNGGPAAQLGNSGATEGPPSVS
jgi:hypothetical protein